MLTWTNIAILQENNSGHFDKDFEVLCAEKRACAGHTMSEPLGNRSIWQVISLHNRASSMCPYFVRLPKVRRAASTSRRTCALFLASPELRHCVTKSWLAAGRSTEMRAKKLVAPDWLAAGVQGPTESPTDSGNEIIRNCSHWHHD